MCISYDIYCLQSSWCARKKRNFFQRICFLQKRNSKRPISIFVIKYLLSIQENSRSRKQTLKLTISYTHTLYTNTIQFLSIQFQMQTKYMYSTLLKVRSTININIYILGISKVCVYLLRVSFRNFFLKVFPFYKSYVFIRIKLFML